MSIPTWFSRSVGRVREGTKAHLVLTAYLLPGSARGVRVLDTFGDFYIVLVVKRDVLPRFDEINKHWIAHAEG